MNFFTNLSQLGITNIDIKVVIKEGIVSVLVDPKSTARDKSLQIIQPVSISGTAEEIDAEFFNIISEPFKKTAGVFSNIEDHEKSVDEASKKKSDTAAAAKKKKTDKTEESSDEETESGENGETKTAEVKKEKPAPKPPKEKPVPEYKFKKYEDAVREITDVPNFKLKATNKLQLKEKVDYLLVMDKENKFALEWEKKIKEFVPSIFDDEDDEEVSPTPPPPPVEAPAPPVEEKVQEPVQSSPPPPPVTADKKEVPEDVVQKIAEYKSSFEKTAESAPAPPPPPAPEQEAPNPFDDDDDLPDTDYESMTD